MSAFENRKCVPCMRGAKPLSEEEIRGLIKDIPAWRVDVIHNIPRLVRQFKFPDFNLAMQFAIRVGEIAEMEEHHPALLVEYGKVTVSWWTHRIDGLHLNDFIMAAKTDKLYSR